MRRAFVAALRMVLVATLLLGLVYPLTITGLAQLSMPGRADGSLVRADGRVVGSALLGQAFDGAGWFHGRPDAFDPTASGAGNLGPTNPALGAAIAGRLEDAGRAGADPVPVDALTSSGSGLDPHISPASARLQAPTVARARGLPVDDVLALVEAHIEGPDLGFLGSERVNVLALNLALDAAAAK